MSKYEIRPRSKSNIKFKRKPRTDWARLMARIKADALVNGTDWRHASIIVRKGYWRSLDSHNWSFILTEFPEFTNRCPWDKLHRNHPRIWAELIKARPELADRCPWVEFDDYDWFGSDLCRNENWTYEDEIFIKLSSKDRSRIKKENYKNAKV